MNEKKQLSKLTKKQSLFYENQKRGYKDGVEMDRIPLAASENVEFANFFDRLGDVARGWNG